MTSSCVLSHPPPSYSSTVWVWRNSSSSNAVANHAFRMALMTLEVVSIRLMQSTLASCHLRASSAITEFQHKAVRTL